MLLLDHYSRSVPCQQQYRYNLGWNGPLVCLVANFNLNGGGKYDDVLVVKNPNYSGFNYDVIISSPTCMMKRLWLLV